MQLHSPLYGASFTYYLRTGRCAHLQYKSFVENSQDVLRERLEKLSRHIRLFVEERIGRLEELFARYESEWIISEKPDTQAIEDGFEKAYREMIGKLAEMVDIMPQEDIIKRLERSENFLNARFGQQLDAEIQPHYGVEYFTWQGGDGENSCDNCGAHSGQVFRWDENAGPPGCDHCQCSAEPYIDDPPIEPVYPELTILPALRAIRLVVQQWERLQRARQQEKPAPEHSQSKPSEKVLERPKNIPEHWKVEPTKKGDGRIYKDPKNSGNYVKVQRGNPNSSQAGQRYDNVRVQKNGVSYDKYGNTLPSQGSEESHIPLDEFNPDILEKIFNEGL